MKNMIRTTRDILKKDTELKREVEDLVKSGKNLPVANKNGISHRAIYKAMIGPVNELPKAEAMIRLHLRPALLIKNNRIEPPASAEMRKRIMPYFAKLESRIPSIGRIDFLKAGRPFGGTGWMITEDILVTNRHVAGIFAEKKGKVIVFRKNQIGDTIQAFIDFKEEYVGKNIAAPEFEIPLERVLYMTGEGKSQPDIAFIKVKKHSRLPAPVPVSDKPLRRDDFISVIGYPAYDPDAIISPGAASSVFGDIYNVKRCSPGEVMAYEKGSWYFYHDCTTLGGNSGSAVIENSTGNAVGLHFMGEVEKENFAVKAAEIIKQLRKIKGKVFTVPENKEAKSSNKKDGSVTLNEAPKASYVDREGFKKDFLGKKFPVALPVIKKNKEDILTFPENGKSQSELRYTHFSMVMNKKRRMCFFSACNIDGSLSKKGVARVTWKTDPRLPKNMQIKNECYGNPPKFSRGHMTRKEDPIWGDMKTAKEACADTFHVTNATPQMQPFNAPVWLALEDYALEHARQDEMKISVFTGPVFSEKDPVKFKVKIPVEFFKVITFIHDKSGKLCATAYTVSQDEYLKPEEFVYGEFKTYQVSIKSIERKTGLSFGKLSSADPVKGREEAIIMPLASVDDVRFA